MPCNFLELKQIKQPGTRSEVAKINNHEIRRNGFAANIFVCMVAYMYLIFIESFIVEEKQENVYFILFILRYLDYILLTHTTHP